MARVLIVEGCDSLRRQLRRGLCDEGHEAHGARDATEAAEALRRHAFDLALVEHRTGEGDGLGLLRRLRAQAPELRVVVAAADATVEGAVEAMQCGASSYLVKPVAPGALRSLLAPAVSARADDTEGGDFERSDGAAFAAILGESRPMRELLDLVARVAVTDSTVLITGETGTGKELVGRAVHAASRRSGRVFCALNSAAFPEMLLESELFGHRRGAFTGASSHKRGLLESAHGGTVFLDEVAEMPLSMQAKLLRFLQTGEIRPVGGETTRLVDVRLVTATNKDLEQEVRAGRFRADLFYRLAVIPIHVPALRERPEDVAPLALHFLQRFASRLGKALGGIEPDALALLTAYPWPGNVRELENTVERGVALCRGSSLGSDDLPERVRRPRPPEAEPESVASLELLERRHILATLERVGWSRKRAAEVLQISTTTLWRRLKVFGIEEPRLRPGAGPSPPGSRRI
jgi:DNA-binding NtrC family response regulator